MKSAFNGFVGKVDITEERISDCEDRSIEIPKLKCKENNYYYYWY